MSESFGHALELSSLAGKLLGHPARLRILQLLSERDCCASADLFAEIPLSRGSINQHLAALKDAGWIQTTLYGSQIQYCIRTTEMTKALAELMKVVHLLQRAESPACPPIQPVSHGQVLFLCTGNSCRSQMAEGFFNQLAAGIGWNAMSAGTVPAGQIHPLARAVMQEKQIDLADQYPKSVQEILGQSPISLVIFVCSEAEENCPYLFPYAHRKIKMPFEDPAAYRGSDEEILVKFRQVRDQIQTKIQTLVGELTLGVQHG